jgi:septal ring factor EnvC (AmiA/AmiB activator)
VENKSNIAIVHLSQELHEIQTELKHTKDKKERLEAQISNFEFQCKQLSEAIIHLESLEN